MRRRRPDARPPVRSCIGCRERRPNTALVRVTRSDHGITVDGPSDGRGAWLCRSETGGIAGRCLDAAVAGRAFRRSWRVDLSADEHRELRERSGERDE